jgi:hypothetical protein
LSRFRGCNRDTGERGAHEPQIMDL